MIMAKTLIGNVKGNDGRGISKIEKTATTGDVDTYTITYTDNTTSTYEVHNGDTIAIQRQIVPSADIESSTTATKSYGVGDYLILNGTLRKVTAPIAMGNQITNYNSKATTVTGEIERQHVTVETGTATQTSSSNCTLKSCNWEMVGNLVYVSLEAKMTSNVEAGNMISIGLSGLPSNMKLARSVGWSGTTLFLGNLEKDSLTSKIMITSVSNGINFGFHFISVCW